MTSQPDPTTVIADAIHRADVLTPREQARAAVDALRRAGLLPEEHTLRPVVQLPPDAFDQDVDGPDAVAATGLVDCACGGQINGWHSRDICHDHDEEQIAIREHPTVSDQRFATGGETRFADGTA